MEQGLSTINMRFLDCVQNHDDVWVCTHKDIATHWMVNYPA